MKNVLNQKNENGSINLLKVTGSETSYTISPFHPDFRSQIEDGIWEVVCELNNKGYYTVDSCQGHFDNENDDYCHFTVVVFGDGVADFLKKSLKMIGVDIRVTDTWIQETAELEVINFLTMSSASKILYVNFRLLHRDFMFSKIIRVLLTPLIQMLILRRIKKLPHVNLLVNASR